LNGEELELMLGPGRLIVGENTIVGTTAGHNVEIEMGAVDDASDSGEVGPARTQEQEQKRRLGKRRGFEEPVAVDTNCVAEAGLAQSRRSTILAVAVGEPDETAVVRLLGEEQPPAVPRGY
jgi:hypothetical protein